MSNYDNIKVYPNPFNKEFTIHSPCIFAERARVQIFDVLGRNHEINDHKYFSNEMVINAENLINGVYYIIITDNNNGEVLLSQKVYKE
jgi:hypothetical protein